MNRAAPALVLMLALLFGIYLVANDFNWPTLFASETAETYGVVYETVPYHAGAGVRLQVVRYRYKVNEDIYTSEYRTGIIQGAKQLNDVLKVQYEVTEPSRSTFEASFVGRPKDVDPELFVIFWKDMAMFRPTLLIHGNPRKSKDLSYSEQPYLTELDSMAEVMHVPVFYENYPWLWLSTKGDTLFTVKDTLDDDVELIYFNDTVFIPITAEELLNWSTFDTLEH